VALLDIRFRFFAASLVLAVSSNGPAVLAQEVYVDTEQQQALFEAARQSQRPEVSAVVNLFSNVLAFEYPKDWVPAYRAEQPGFFMLEYVPFGENVREDWTRMLTVQAFGASRAVTIDPVAFAKGFGSRIASACPKGNFFRDLGEVAVAGAEAYRIAFGCRLYSAAGTEFGEATVLQATKRNGDLIVVQYAARTPLPNADDPLLDQTTQDYFLSLLDRLTLNDSPKAD
jgi:hypothetical protein